MPIKKLLLKLTHFWEELKNDEARLIGWLKDFVQHFGANAVAAINNLKELVNNPEIKDLVEHLFKGLGPKAASWFQDVLVDAAAYAGVVIDCVGANDNLAGIIACIIEKVRAMAPGQRNAFYAKLASTVAMRAYNRDKHEDDQIDEALSDYYVQKHYLKTAYKDYIQG